MRIAAFLLTLGLLPLNGALAEAPQQNPMQAVPTQFQGDWNSRMEDCDSGLNDSALSIDAHWIRFYESGGPILAVIVMGKNHLSLIARLTSSEDGRTVWDAARQYGLSLNGAVLTDMTVPGDKETMVRYKCPHHIPHGPSSHLSGRKEPVR